MAKSQFPDFQFSRTNSQLRRSLEQSRIFGDLSEQLLTSLVETMNVRLVPGGDLLFKQGDDSTSLLVVVSGRFVAVMRHADGSSKRLAEIGPGSSIGEIGLVLQQPRGADVIALRDSSVGVLSQRQFDALLATYPTELNRAVTRTLYEYTSLPSSRPQSLGATTIAVVPLSEHIDISRLCRDLAKELTSAGKVHLLTPEEGKQFHRGGTSVNSSQRLDQMEQDFDFLLFESTNKANGWSQLAVRQADQVVLVANADTSVQIAETITQQLLSGPGFEMVRKTLVLLHPAGTKKPTVNLQWHHYFELERIMPLQCDHPPSTQRLMRFLTDNAIGLVLGGGGARGLAHIGVLQALQQNNIAVDMICGNSMGALIGAQYTYGIELDDLLESTQRFVKGGEHPALPLIALLGGNRVRRDLQRMFGDAQLQDLWQPFYPVSCNLSKANINVHETGPLWQAVLASNSPAGIVPPVVYQGDLLVDAALLDNVPVRALRQKLRFGTLIAVDVDVSEELSVDPAIEQLSGWQILKQRLFKRQQNRLPGIIDVLNRSGHLGGLSHRQESKALADHYLQPPVSNFPLMGYNKGAEIVAVGYQYAMNAIAQWSDKP